MSKKKNSENKLSLVVGVDPGKYQLHDKRLMKPVCHQKYENAELTGSMLIQNLDEVALSSKKKATYFVPNSIALLLSVSEKSLTSAKDTYHNKLNDPELELNFQKMEGDRKDNINGISSIICDYLEDIQTSIVFGYTALEAFVNLSIPNDYTYTTEKNSKGISETFDKEAVERWLPLKTKIKNILSEIYQTKKIENQKWWGHFSNLENYRNDIIHQKSISHTEFYKLYFKQSIFKVCISPIEVIQFFHDSHADENKTNPIWPWLEDATTLPINPSYNSQNFEVVGNVYERINKKL